jgi:SNF2 family DNA or RNA helicase
MHRIIFVLQVTVLLVSLKAGSVGLNLVAASHVIIVDPWWKGALEDQAMGRAHRIGQTRPVTVYRLVVEDIIEERILALQVSSNLLLLKTTSLLKS